MSKPIKELSAGNIKLTLWQGEYNGKTNYSITIKKSYQDQQTKEWKTSDFFTLPDLRDVLVLVLKAVNGGVHEKDIVQKQPQQPKLQPKQNVAQNINETFNNENDDNIPW